MVTKASSFSTRPKIGLATQCCLFQNWEKSVIQDSTSQYLANLALKVNAKVGGSNVALLQDPPNQKPHTVYFGADVNHPSNHDKECPSIATVVMSINYPLNNRYVVTMQRQKYYQEIISNLVEMCRELLQEYAEATENTLPETIVFFRDGVGEWQFDEVRRTELEPLKIAFKETREGYNPKITFILAQKRHHTRLFQKSGLDNVLPGTVVDTRIVHPSGLDFYPCSHYNTLRTSRVTHYYVLFNESGFSQEYMQTLIYNLCFTFATCTKPVSLVPPIYYADQAAYKGRLYVEAERDPPSDDRINILLRNDKSIMYFSQITFSGDNDVLFADLSTLMYLLSYFEYVIAQFSVCVE